MNKFIYPATRQPTKVMVCLNKYIRSLGDVLGGYMVCLNKIYPLFGCDVLGGYYLQIRVIVSFEEVAFGVSFLSLSALSLSALSSDLHTGTCHAG